MSSGALGALEQCECMLSPDSRSLAAAAVEGAEAAVARLQTGAEADSGDSAAAALRLALDALLIRDADPRAHLAAMRAAAAVGALPR